MPAWSAWSQQHKRRPLIAIGLMSVAVGCACILTLGPWVLGLDFRYTLAAVVGVNTVVSGYFGAGTKTGAIICGLIGALVALVLMGDAHRQVKADADTAKTQSEQPMAIAKATVAEMKAAGFFAPVPSPISSTPLNHFPSEKGGIPLEWDAEVPTSNPFGLAFSQTVAIKPNPALSWIIPADPVDVIVTFEDGFSPNEDDTRFLLPRPTPDSRTDGRVWLFGPLPKMWVTWVGIPVNSTSPRPRIDIYSKRPFKVKSVMWIPHP